MSKKRVSAVAVAAGLSISALTFSQGFANSAPLDPPPPCPNGNCHGGPGGPGGPHSPQAPETSAAPATSAAPQTTAPPATTAAPQTTAPHSSQTTTAPATQTTTPPASQTTTPAEQTTTPPSGHTTTPAEQTTTPPSAQTTTPAGSQSTTPSGTRPTRALVAPSTQPPHQPYAPRGTYLTGSVDVGGPTDANVGFSIVGHGAPPPPPPRGFGWNDGPAPGHPPPHWEGPPPPGGWDGPPPPGGWNRPWGGPPRDVVYARSDFGPFAYNTFTVVPVFNWQFGGWGYWYFGVWIPLY
jgi:hypothetical protein